MADVKTHASSCFCRVVAPMELRKGEGKPCEHPCRVLARYPHTLAVEHFVECAFASDALWPCSPTFQKDTLPVQGQTVSHAFFAGLDEQG